MWKPYLNVIREQAAGALNILDRFHIMSNMNKALDEVRRQEVRRLKTADKRPVLKHARGVNPAPTKFFNSPRTEKPGPESLLDSGG